MEEVHIEQNDCLICVKYYNSQGQGRLKSVLHLIRQSLLPFVFTEDGHI